MRKNVIQIMPEFDLAGAETMCENLVYKLQESGRYNVYVVSLYAKKTAITERMTEKGISVIYLNKREGVDLLLIFRLARLLKKLHIDIIHTHRYVMLYAIPAAIFAGVSIRVHTIHNIATKEVDSKRRMIARFFFKFANVIPVSISPLVHKSVIEEYGMSYINSPIVYNGTDLSKCIEKLNYESHRCFKFIHIGRFSRQKNHLQILKAASELDTKGYDFKIELIGWGEDLELIRNKAEELNISKRIVFSGTKSNVYPSLAASDCFILPSLYEGMPCTLIEAMGCGLPIIASAVGGVPDMIENGKEGILIEPTSEALVSAMISIMRDSRKREYYGRNALLKSKVYSSDNMAAGYISIYDSNE